MSVRPIQDTFGLHARHFPATDTRKGNEDVNFLNIAGYIPGVGIAIAIGRCIGVYRTNPQGYFHQGTYASQKGFLVSQVIRAIVEALGLGLLLLIPDIVVSAKRAYSAAVAKSSGSRAAAHPYLP